MAAVRAVCVETYEKFIVPLGRFLAEVKAAGQLSDNQERYSHIPIVSILPIVGKFSF
jgi:hypothetical protein